MFDGILFRANEIENFAQNSKEWPNFDDESFQRAEKPTAYYVSEFTTHFPRHGKPHSIHWRTPLEIKMEEVRRRSPPNTPSPKSKRINIVDEDEEAEDDLKQK